MKIVHWAPFAPYRCGLYEAARDCVRADQLRGHEVLLCDTGVCTAPGVREAPAVGAVDARGGWALTTAARPQALDADLWVCHDGVPDDLAARCQVPMIWMIHGRPLACFRPEQENKPGRPYTIIRELSTWPRVKALVTMWAEHEPYWRLVAGDKLRSTVDPPVDGARFKPTGKKRDLTKTGKVNLLIADSWRDDVDVYEVAMAAYLAAQQIDGLKVHFWAVEPLKQGPWQVLWGALDEAGALGEIHPRESEFPSVLRAMDLLVSPHAIGVRTISEALHCGVPVVAAEGCRYTTYTGRPSDAQHMADAIVRCVRDLERDREAVRAAALAACAPFSLDLFGERMERIYREATGLDVSVTASAGAWRVLEEAAP